MSYQSEVLADSPVGYWRLGETSGTNFDDISGNNNDGTSLNSPTLGQVGATNDGNKAVRFTAVSSQLINMGDPAVLDVADVFTLEAWVKMTAVGAGTNRGIMSKGQAGYYIRVGTTDAIEVIKSGVALIATSTITLPDTAYHHVVWTKNTSTNFIYIDGVDRTGTVTNVACTATTFSFRVACDSTTDVPAEFSNDTLDEIAVYPTALSQARIQAHFAAASESAGNLAPPLYTSGHGAC